MASKALTGWSPRRPVRQAKANTISAKYSAGPNASAQRDSSGVIITMPTVAIIEPMNELQAEIDSATPPMPFLAIG